MIYIPDSVLEKSGLSQLAVELGIPDEKDDVVITGRGLLRVATDLGLDNPHTASWRDVMAVDRAKLSAVQQGYGPALKHLILASATLVSLSKPAPA